MQVVQVILLRTVTSYLYDEKVRDNVGNSPIVYICMVLVYALLRDVPIMMGEFGELRCDKYNVYM